MNKKTIFLLCAVVLFLLVLFCLWRQSVPKIEIYEYVHPVKQDIVRTSRVHGQIGSRRQATVFPQSSGMLKNIFVKDGDHVRKGQRLAAIEISPQIDATEEYNANEKNARISLEQAQRDEKRAKDLLQKGAISVRDYENAQNTLEMAKKALSLASSRVRSNNETRVIDAPFDGVICNLQLVENSFISNQTPFCSIYDPNEQIFIGMADEIDVDALREGMKLVVTPGVGKNKKIPACLTYISDKGETINGMTKFEIKAEFIDTAATHLRMGYSANAELEVERKDNVLSVSEAFIQYDPKPFVYVLTSNPNDEKHQKWNKLYVTIGLSDGINIEINGKITTKTIIRGHKK